MTASESHCSRLLWADIGLRPVIGTTLDAKVMPQPLEDREVDLLLSCWRKWNYQTVPSSALNQWLRNVDAEWGPDCVDSPHFRRVDIDCFEMVRLVEDSGFGFLPEGDLLNQPTMDVVLTAGLRLCALEFSSEQLKLLAYMCLHVLIGSAPRKLSTYPVGFSRLQVLQHARGCHLYMCGRMGGDPTDA